jgi:hypothetical protein
MNAGVGSLELCECLGFHGGVVEGSVCLEYGKLVSDTPKGRITLKHQEPKCVVTYLRIPDEWSPEM